MSPIHRHVDLQRIFIGLEPAPNRLRDVAIYRIVQELITNVVKHAEASRTKLSIRFSKRIIAISLINNGKVFDPEVTVHNGIGLRTLKTSSQR